MIFIAVVYNPNNDLDEEFSRKSFTGKVKQPLIERCLKTKAEWEANGNGPYEIVVGTLTERVEPVVKISPYRLVKL